jgi:hypothetical protein
MRTMDAEKAKRITPQGRSNGKGAVEEGGEEALCLTQRLTLHRTQTLYSVNQGRERNAPVAGSEAGRPGCQRVGEGTAP